MDAIDVVGARQVQALFRNRPALMLEQAAPHARLDVLPLDTDTAARDLASGDIDLAIASIPLGGRIRSTPITRDRYVGISRSGRFGSAPGLDALSLKSFLTRHDSGIWTLVAPTEPTIADSINPSSIGNILKLLRTAFDYVVIDTPPAFSEPVLAAFDESDWLVMLATLDVPSIKNLRLTLQTMELLHFPKGRIRVVVNRADSKVGLRMPDVEKLLSSRIDTTIPSSRSVPLSVNKGSPIMLEEPKGPVAEAIRRVAAQLTEPQIGRTKHKQRRSLFARS